MHDNRFPRQTEYRSRRRAWQLAGCLALLAIAWAPIAAAAGACVRASEEVTTAVAIRVSADTNSHQFERLEPGQVVSVVGEVPHWYRITTPSHQDGFVSKAWTELAACPAGGAGRADFEFHAIDVGTGLALFVRGDDFALVYDAGSNDDYARGDRNRVLAYLAEVAPDLQTIDHLIISHPHRDHIELLPDLFGRYVVRHVWHSGASNDTCGFRNLLRAIAAHEGVRFHTGLLNYGKTSIGFPAGCSASNEQFDFIHGGRISTEPVALGQDASMQFLYIDGKTRSDLNYNSLVVRLDLGARRILIMGDAGGGGRNLPSLPPHPTSIEGILTACCPRELGADVLVVGHHGSMTSSRTSLLDAVDAGTFIVSSGPFPYSSRTLPDAEVIAELERRGTVWRSDLDDQACRGNPDKIGAAADGRPGGCHNVRLRISSGAMMADYFPPP